MRRKRMIILGDIVMKDSIRKLNDEIEECEKAYVTSRLEYEEMKANLLLGTDFTAELGKAKPTVAEKDAWVKLECIGQEEEYKMLGAELSSLKRLFEIMLKELGDE